MKSAECLQKRIGLHGVFNGPPSKKAHTHTHSKEQTFNTDIFLEV